MPPPKEAGGMILSAFALVLLTVIMLWTSYHIPIMLTGVVGFKHKPNDGHPSIDRLPTFSLIVPTKNEAKVITRGLSALLNLDYPRTKMEILVVDGDSKDGTAEQCRTFVKAYPRTVRLLKEKASKGKPKALNYALPHVTGEIVGVFDADSVPEKNVLKRMVVNFTDPTVMAVQGRTSSLNREQNMLTKVAAMEEQSWLRSLVNGREKMGLFVPLTGSCQFVRKRILEELGGWAEDSLAEDVELSLRLVEQNYVVKYASEACSREETPSQLRNLIQQRTRWYRGYMEEALKYGRLVKWGRLNRKIVDAEVFLMGPFVMVLCLASYLNWALTMFVFTSSLSLLPSLAVVLTSLTLFSIGVALTLMAKPARLRNLVWIPFIYAYWLLQTMIAVRAFLQMLFHRPRRWQKTMKHGSQTVNPAN
jgi:cellulose synthase/poly-beta-1,6-N-acetylglucosamine synthase-like glycosyltransferase